jgi:predicted metal-dependent hydrolase
MAEEIEHKAVAFDVFRAVGGTERQRRFAFWFAAFFLLKDVYRNMTLILKSQNAWSFRMRLRVLSLLFGRQGICRRIRSDIAVFRRPDFHPWQVNNRELVKLAE